MAYFFKIKALKVVVAGVLCMVVQGCAFIAENSTPSKEAQLSKDRHQLDEKFWEVFHENRYDEIGATLETFKFSYLKNPKDPMIASRIAFLHAWRVTERARISQPYPSITDDLTMAARYFESAHTLEPHNPVTHGFYAAFSLADGTIHHNDKKTTAAWFKAQKAIKAWPEFNQFTVAYLMNALPYDPKSSQMAIDLLNDVVSRCLDQAPSSDPQILAQQLDMKRSTPLSDQAPSQSRACGNGNKAPYNIQGFLLNMADMLVRHGDVSNAEHIYRTLALTKDFSTWPYKGVVSHRLNNVSANVNKFREVPPFENADVGTMFTSTYACMACHQRR